MNNISIVVPLFNESENINKLINEIINTVEKQFNYEIILVNDCSSDDTFKILEKLIKNKKIKIINNERNFGQSKSIHNGVKQSLHNNIITIDGDGQNNPKDILNLAKVFFNENIQLVSGIRTKRKDKFIKIISSKIANYVRSLILKDNCPDTGCGLKIFKKDIFLNFDYFNGMHRFIPALFVLNDYNVKYVPVDHRYREFGISKYGTFDRLTKGLQDLIKVRKILKKKNK